MANKTISIRQRLHQIPKNISKLLFRKEILYIFIFMAVAATLYDAVITLDPDFGWHLTMGNLIIKNGIPATDPFSYTMASYPFVDHEWLTNIFIAKTFPIITKTGLAVFYTIIALSAFNIAFFNNLSRKKAKRKYLFYRYFMIFALFFTCILVYFGVRPQIESWLLLAVLLGVLLDEKKWVRYGLFLPLLFVLWVNLHGSFAEGIAVSFLVIAIRSIRKRRLILKDWVILFLMLAATFITPYGWRSWWEIWMQITDSSLRWTISEWQPVVFNYRLSFVVLLTLSLFLLWKYRKKFYIEELLIYVFLLIQAVSSTRHVPLWLITTIPLLNRGLDYLINDVIKVPLGLKRLKILGKYFIAGVVVLTTVETILSVNGVSQYSEDVEYPLEAINFIKSNKLEGHMFSNYGWGGYLIWKLPEQKVFIDGRMPSWRTVSAKGNESKYAMKEYIDIVSKGNYQQYFKKYGIGIVLIPKSTDGNTDENRFSVINFLRNIFYPEDGWGKLNGQLKKDQWPIIYEDKTAVIYYQRSI